MISTSFFSAGNPSIERLLELCRGHVPEVAMQPPGVVPMHPTERRKLEVIDHFPWPRLSWPADKLSLVIPVNGLSEGIVITVTDSPDRGCRPDLGETPP